jgi:hypothetical protein
MSLACNIQSITKTKTFDLLNLDYFHYYIRELITDHSLGYESQHIHFRADNNHLMNLEEITKVCFFHIHISIIIQRIYLEFTRVRLFPFLFDRQNRRIYYSIQEIENVIFARSQESRIFKTSEPCPTAKIIFAILWRF